MRGRTYSLEAVPNLTLRLLAAPQRVLLQGSADLTPFSLRLVAQAAGGGRAVRFICGDNRFDPYLIAATARSAQRDAVTVLEQIHLARAFTAYQLYELVRRLDTHYTGELIVIASPAATFLDDDVPVLEAARYFYRMLWHLVRLTQQGVPLLLTQPALPPTRRHYFLTDLARLADVVLHLNGSDWVRLERHRQPAIPQLKTAPAELE